jgi:hypothetical protein
LNDYEKQWYINTSKRIREVSEEYNQGAYHEEYFVRSRIDEFCQTASKILSFTVGLILVPIMIFGFIGLFGFLLL